MNRLVDLHAVLKAFVLDECIPAEAAFMNDVKTMGFQQVPPVLDRLKARSKELGLWNLFLPADFPGGPGLSLEEYAPLCELMGWTPLASEACNCSAPDTGNMELLIKYGSRQQKERWLTPLLEGTIRSAFLMTEPDVASSDGTQKCGRFSQVWMRVFAMSLAARNVRTTITRHGSEYVINGRKWWSTGFQNPHTELLLVMGKTDPDADPMQQQSIIIVPRSAPGVRLVRSLTVFGYDDAPEGHAEVELCDVRVPLDNLVWAEGKGFEIAQGRLGPGRIHHCMRAVGVAERALAVMVSRASESTRSVFGRLIVEHATTQVDLAESRIDIDTARCLVLNAARMIDRVGAARARKEIAAIKVAVPRLCLRVVDRAIQVHGGAGVGPDTFLPRAFAGLRSLRIADGPDIVHLRTIGLLELRDQARSLSRSVAAHPVPQSQSGTRTPASVAAPSPRL